MLEYHLAICRWEDVLDWIVDCTWDCDGDWEWVRVVWWECGEGV